MKFADGGYRPGYNVQFRRRPRAGIIVGVEVTNEGTDQEQLPPMLGQVKQRYGRLPAESLVDGGFASLEAIDEAAATRQCGIRSIEGRARSNWRQGKTRTQQERRQRGGGRLAERMGTVAAKGVYRLRCQTAEWVNA